MLPLVNVFLLDCPHHRENKCRAEFPEELERFVAAIGGIADITRDR